MLFCLAVEAAPSPAQSRLASERDFPSLPPPVLLLFHRFFVTAHHLIFPCCPFPPLAGLTAGSVSTFSFPFPFPRLEGLEDCVCRAQFARYPPRFISVAFHPLRQELPHVWQRALRVRLLAIALFTSLSTFARSVVENHTCALVALKLPALVLIHLTVA